MSRRIAAKEARDIVDSVNMEKLLLDEIYSSIKFRAKRGQREAIKFVGKFEMYDVEAVISQLREDGYRVELKGDGLIFKRIKEFTKIIAKW